MERAPTGKLRNRIFLVVAIGLAPLAAAAALGIVVVQNSHREDVARLEAAVLNEKAQEVNDYVTGDILGHPRVITPSGGGVENSTAAQMFTINETMHFLPFLEAESFVDLSGKETVRVDRDNPDGYPDAELRDVSATPGFRAARTGNYYIGPVSYSAANPSVTFSSPVKDDAGNVVAVITGDADLTQVQTIIAEGTIGTTGYLYLVDAEGTVIGGGGPMNAPGAAATTSVANTPIIQKLLAGNDLLTADTQMQYQNISGTPVIAAAKYLPAFGWGLVAEWPAGEANAIVNSLLLRSALALAAVLLIVLITSFLLAAYIVRPIKKLQEGAARVAQGDFNEGVYIRTGDELQSLGNSFNDMVQGLKQLQALKDEFVFIAAHELRTPVAAMKGYLSLILDGTAGAITEPTRAYIEKVIASDNRLVQLVGDLLEVARSEAGRLTIKVAPTDLAPPIQSVLDELKSLADEKSVRMVYAPDANLPKVMADPDRIKEVMVNLVGNAIKYMGGAGTVTITHELATAAAGGTNTLVTHVADTGLGIAKGAQEKLFEKFYRVQTEKTQDITGTGLGLFIVREIMEKMGGTIWVASEEGKGSIFSFSLPTEG